MKLAICNLSIIPLRLEASHRSEMVSQVLFAEIFEVLDECGDFVKIQMCDTGYKGWILNSQFVFIDFAWTPTQKIVDVEGAVAISKNQEIPLLHGTRLVGQELEIGNNRYNVSSGIRTAGLENFDNEMQRLVKYYLNSPYLWGGRSRYGIDCSGFSQLIYTHFGVSIARDAWQQAEQGTSVDFLSEAKKGDLAFFDNEEGNITHVGVLLNENTIIHASGRVRIDKIDNEGIFNEELKKITHKLRIVKRFFNL